MQERQSRNDSGENGNSSDDFKNVSDLHSDCRTGPISIRRFRIGKQFRKNVASILQILRSAGESFAASKNRTLKAVPDGRQALLLFREN
jgi:hypothetical protein